MANIEITLLEIFFFHQNVKIDWENDVKIREVERDRQTDRPVWIEKNLLKE